MKNSDAAAFLQHQNKILGLEVRVFKQFIVYAKQAHLQDSPEFGMLLLQGASDVIRIPELKQQLAPPAPKSNPEKATGVVFRILHEVVAHWDI